MNSGYNKPAQDAAGYVGNIAPDERGQVIRGMEASKKRAYTQLEEAMKLVEADAAHRSLAADQALMLHTLMPPLSMALNTLAEGIFKWCQHQGFWPSGWIDRSDAMKKTEKIALMHTELSELLEGIRKGDSVNEAEECADIAIRLLDYCGAYGIDLGGAVHSKMIANYQRPFRHGKQF